MTGDVYFWRIGHYTCLLVKPTPSLGPLIYVSIMTATLLLIAFCWLLPLSVVGWLYFRDVFNTPTVTRTETETRQTSVEIALDDASWMALADDVSSVSTTTRVYRIDVAKGRAVVRVHTPSGKATYRECTMYLN